MLEYPPPLVSFIFYTNTLLIYTLQNFFLYIFIIVFKYQIFLFNTGCDFLKIYCGQTNNTFPCNTLNFLRGKICSNKKRSVIIDKKGKEIVLKNKGYVHQF